MQQSILEKELNLNEHILWQGQPKQGIVFRPVDIFVVPFSLFWAGFVFNWQWSAITQDLPIVFKLWGIPFMIIGIYITIGRFIIDMYFRKNTHYVLTNERAIIMSGIFHQKIQSINYKKLAHIEFTDHNNDYGTITFGSEYMIGKMSYLNPMGIKSTNSEFECIKNADMVHRLIKDEQRK